MTTTKTAKRKTNAKGVGSTKTAKRKTKAKGVGTSKTGTQYAVIRKDILEQGLKVPVGRSFYGGKRALRSRIKNGRFQVFLNSKWQGAHTIDFDFVEKPKAKAKSIGSVQKKTLSGSKYHRVSKPVGGVMNSRNQKQLVQLGSMKPAQRFMFPNGKAAYTFKGFTKANSAKYESAKGETYESKNLKVNVVLI